MSANRAFLASRPPLILVLIAAVAGLLAVQPAGADGITRTYIMWNNPAGGSYFEASNWTPANVPDELGEVPVLPILSGPYTVTVDQDVVVWGLEVCSTGKLHLDGATMQTDGVPNMRGTLRIDHGGTLRVNRPLIINGGTIASGEGGGSLLVHMDSGVLGGINAQGGTFLVDGGDLTIRSATILNGQVLRNGSSHALRVDQAGPQGLVVTPNAEVVVDGAMSLMSNGVTFYNYGTVRVPAGGQIHFGVTTEYTVDGDGEIVLEGGNLNTGYVNGSVVNAAAHTIRGCGTISASLVNYGTVDIDCPGLMVGSPQLINKGKLRIHSGTMRVGSYSQLADGVLDVGLASPALFGRLEVTGSAQLDGVIEATPIGGFTPAPGSQFDVLAYGSRTGEFSALAQPEGLGLTPLYSVDALNLSVNAVTGIDPHLPAALRFAGRGVASGVAFVLDLPRDAILDVRAYDVRGREVARLANGMRPAGVHTFPLGAGLSSGVYFARAEVRSGGTIETRSARVATTR